MEGDRAAKLVELLVQFCLFKQTLTLEPVSKLFDQQGIALTQLQMELDQDARLSELRDRQQADSLMVICSDELHTNLIK